MFERFSRSVELAKASWNVLRSDKELLIFPLVSFLLTVLVTISFAVPLWATGALERAADGGFDAVTLVLGFLYYFVTYTVIIFCNAALVGGALIRLEGGDPTARDGFRIAFSRLPAILGYAAISATVGVILRAIAERGGIVGAIGAAIVGVAWNLATFLAIPVLVVENVGPIEAVKRSGGLLKRTWGEQVVGNVGISLVFGLLALAVILAGGALIAVMASIAVPLAIAAIVLVVILVAAITLVGAAVSGIFTASLYRYVTKATAARCSPRRRSSRPSAPRADAAVWPTHSAGPTHSAVPLAPSTGVSASARPPPRPCARPAPPGRGPPGCRSAWSLHPSGEAARRSRLRAGRGAVP